MSDMVNMLFEESLKTLMMTFMTTFFAYLFGLPLGVFLITSDKGGLRPHPILGSIVGLNINLLRSAPLSDLLLHATIGPKVAIFALTFSAAPFVARVVEQSLLEVDKGVIEAALSMGASPRQIVWKVYLVEAFPSLVNGMLLSLTTILAYTAMAGFIGAGGLGDVAIRFGYHRYDFTTMIVVVIVIVVLVQIIQMLGERYVRYTDKRIKE